MIDLEKCVKLFNEYTNNYKDILDSEYGIQYKIDHTYRVLNNTKLLCESINLNKQNTDIALLIALLHDIGRFEQFKQTGICDDNKSGLNHAMLGVKILKKDDYINNYVQDEKVKEIVLRSILNHSIIKLEESDKKIQMFSKIIRDADKLDIFLEIELDIDDKEITDSIQKSFFNKELASRKKLKNSVDEIIYYLCYVYEIYYKYTLETILKSNKIKTRMKKIENKTGINMKKYQDFMLNYISERLSELC